MSESPSIAEQVKEQMDRQRELTKERETFFAQMNTATRSRGYKGLGLINAGGALSMLTWLQSVSKESPNDALVLWLIAAAALLL